jgi:ABC-type uncharacterized transport system permease subunit
MTAQGALQLAGFVAVTVASALGARALLGRTPLEQRILQWTRAGFLLLGLALLAGAWRTPDFATWLLDPRQQWGLLSWLIFFAVLHVHRVKGFKGRTAIIAGMAGWALAAVAWMGLR